MSKDNISQYSLSKKELKGSGNWIVGVSDIIFLIFYVLRLDFFVDISIFILGARL